MFVNAGRVKAVADHLLLCVVLGGAYTHFALGDPIGAFLPAVIAGILIIMRHAMMYQTLRNDFRAEKAAANRRVKKAN